MLISKIVILVDISLFITRSSKESSEVHDDFLSGFKILEMGFSLESLEGFLDVEFGEFHTEVNVYSRWKIIIYYNLLLIRSILTDHRSVVDLLHDNFVGEREFQKVVIRGDDFDSHSPVSISSEEPS